MSLREDFRFEPFNSAETFKTLVTCKGGLNSLYLMRQIWLFWIRWNVLVCIYNETPSLMVGIRAWWEDAEITKSCPGRMYFCLWPSLPLFLCFLISLSWAVSLSTCSHNGISSLEPVNHKLNPMKTTSQNKALFL